MPKIHQIYKQLQRMEDVAVDRAMIAALPTADRLPRRLMALLLLHRRHPDGLLGLVLHFHLFAPDIQHTIASHAGEMFRPIRRAAGMRQTHGPLNAIQIIHRSLSARLAYLAADQLRTGSSEAQCAAGACLLHLARHAASDPRPAVLPQIEPRGIEYLQSAVNEALTAQQRHEQRSVLVAAAWLLLRGEPTLNQLLCNQRQPAAQAMPELVDEGDQPAIVRSLMLFMRMPPLVDAALTGIRRAAQREALGPMLGQHHLLHLPGLAVTLARLEQPETLCLSDAQSRALAPHEARGLPVWLASLPLQRGERIARLAELRHLPDPLTRLMALRRLVGMSERHEQPAQGGAKPAPPATAELEMSGPDGDADHAAEPTLEAIALFCDDPDPQLARIALHHLARRRYRGLARLLMRLINSPHELLRRYASHRLAPIGFQRLWGAWPRLDEQRRVAAGRALAKIDANFLSELARKLEQPEQPVRLRALNMIGELQQGGHFESTLRRLAEEPDEVVASAAVKALGSAGSEAAVESLEKAMEHEDTRVRANAVEALSQVRSTRDVDRHVKQLAHMAEHESNRPRANAIGTLLEMKAGEALPALTRMLADERPAYRISALWLVERMGVLEAARTVAELSTGDPDAEVRRRAEKVAREMLELMSTSAGATALAAPSAASPAGDEHATTPQATAPGPPQGATRTASHGAPHASAPGST